MSSALEPLVSHAFGCSLAFNQNTYASKKSTEDKIVVIWDSQEACGWIPSWPSSTAPASILEPLIKTWGLHELNLANYEAATQIEQTLEAIHNHARVLIAIHHPPKAQAIAALCLDAGSDWEYFQPLCGAPWGWLRLGIWERTAPAQTPQLEHALGRVLQWLKNGTHSYRLEPTLWEAYRQGNPHAQALEHYLMTELPAQAHETPFHALAWRFNKADARAAWCLLTRVLSQTTDPQWHAWLAEPLKDIELDFLATLWAGEEPDGWEADARLWVNHFKDRIGRAEQAIKTIYKAQPSARRSYTRLGIALVETGHAELAPQYFEADVALKRQSPAVWVEYAAAFWAQGNYERAEAIIQGAYEKLSAANDGYGRAAERAQAPDPCSAWERDLQCNHLSPQGARRYVLAALKQHGLLAAIEVSECCKDLLPPNYYSIAAECVGTAMRTGKLNTTLLEQADRWLNEQPWALSPQSTKQREALAIVLEKTPCEIA